MKKTIESIDKANAILEKQIKEFVKSKGGKIKLKYECSVICYNSFFDEIKESLVKAIKVEDDIIFLTHDDRPYYDDWYSLEYDNYVMKPTLYNIAMNLAYNEHD